MASKGKPETIKRYREANKERIQKKSREWNERNKEHIRLWRERNRERFRAQDKARRLASPEKYRQKGRRNYHRRGVDAKWGLPQGTYELLREQQGQLCAICGQMKLVGRFHLDHDHATMQVRGLLCGSCNRALGLLREDPYILRQAMRYVNDPPAAKHDLYVTKLPTSSRKKSEVA